MKSEGDAGDGGQEMKSQVTQGCVGHGTDTGV